MVVSYRLLLAPRWLIGGSYWLLMAHSLLQDIINQSFSTASIPAVETDQSKSAIGIPMADWLLLATNGSFVAPNGSSEAPSGSSLAPTVSSLAPTGSSVAPNGSSVAPTGSSLALNGL